MKNLNKKGSVFIYILVLVIITMFLGMIIFDSNSSLTNERKVENIDNILINNIFYDGRLAIKYDKLVNSNGTGFVDNLSCPDNVIMDGDNWREHDKINTQLISPYLGTQTGAYCSGTYTQHKYFEMMCSFSGWMPIGVCPITDTGDTHNFTIFFKNDFTNFSGATYSGETVSVNLATNPYEAQFHDSDNTLMRFTNSPGTDNIDDNFNSDNYMVTSTGNIYYPKDSNGKVYTDDDVLARKTRYSYITPEAGYLNVFWSNSKFSKVIENNPNNNDNINVKIGDVSSGTLRFDVDEAVDFRLVEFDKTRFDTTGELIAEKTYQKTLTGGILGYLQLVSGELDFADNHTANDFIFDFKNKDYAVFMKNKSAVASTIFYRITGEEKNTGSGIYLVPIDDSNDIITYLGGSIIKRKGDYIYKIEEVYGEK